MLYRNLFFVFAIPFALTGCVSWATSAATWPWAANTNPCAAATCTDAEALKFYIQANQYCRDVQNYYELGGQRSSSTKVAVGTVGAVAGTVIAPVANGSAAKAWSGLSGATNAVQISLDEAFSSTVSIKRRAAVEAAAKSGETAYEAAPDSKAKIIAAINMARACSMSSATADNAAIKALTN